MKTKSRRKRGKPDPAVLADIVKRIVEATNPEKIVLFGSAARGEMGPNSDYDLLVIKGGKFNYWRVLTSIYHQLPGTAAVDVVLVTSEDAERSRDTHCLVICPALKEGKIVYDSESPAARRSARTAKSSAQQPRSRQVARPRRVS
ncbi:MAG TPA: nucleotidyltransferase domain-containing protein [Gemmataceae bacterium]|nr:nucleotidyltransferase domain-containing protein [Gemmataceae bacterium]